MKKNYHTTKLEIILFDFTDLLTGSGEDDAIVVDRSWYSGTSSFDLNN